MKNTVRLYDVLNITISKKRTIDRVLGYNDLFEYSTDTAKLVHEIIFKNQNILNNQTDFEKMFILRFMNKAINFQTLDTFSAKLISLLISKKSAIDFYYKNLDKLLTQTSESNSTGQSVSKHNSLSTSLPQTETDISLHIDSMDYADETNLDKSENTGKDNSVSTSAISVDELEKLEKYLDNIMKDFDRRLFQHLY